MSPSSSPPPRVPRPPRWQFAWPLALVAVIFFASGQSQVAAPGFIPSVDKLSHFSVFGLLATLVLRMFFDPDRPLRTALLAAAAVSLYGLAYELHQSFTPGRSVEVADWVADTSGALVAVLLYARWSRYRAFLEYRPLARATRASEVAPDPVSIDASSAR